MELEQFIICLNGNSRTKVCCNGVMLNDAKNLANGGMPDLNVDHLG